MFWIVFISIYVPIRMYFICIAYHCFNVYVYFSVPIYVLSWLWILLLIAVFFVSNLMYCFLLCQKWWNEQVINIYVFSSLTMKPSLKWPFGVKIKANVKFCTEVWLTVITWKIYNDFLYSLQDPTLLKTSPNVVYLVNMKRNNKYSSRRCYLSFSLQWF